MRKFVGAIKTNKTCSECDFEFEVEDDATEEEIGKQVAFENIDWYYDEEIN